MNKYLITFESGNYERTMSVSWILEHQIRGKGELNK